MKLTQHQAAHQRDGKQDWRTPASLFEALDAEFHFTLDAAASADNALCPRWYGVEQDALKQDWSGEVVWCNPPFQTIWPWVKKASASARAGATVVLLIPASTGSAYWHDLIFGQPNTEVRFLRRIKFNGAKAQAPFGVAVVIFRPQQEVLG